MPMEPLAPTAEPLGVFIENRSFGKAGLQLMSGKHSCKDAVWTEPQILARSDRREAHESQNALRPLPWIARVRARLDLL